MSSSFLSDESKTEKPQEPPERMETITDALKSWRKQKKSFKSNYQLHQDLQAIVAAWATDNGCRLDTECSLFSQHTIMELMEWSQIRTFGQIQRSEVRTFAHVAGSVTTVRLTETKAPTASQEENSNAG